MTQTEVRSINRELRNCFALTLLLAFGWPVYAGSPAIEDSEPLPRITVRIYDYAQVPDKTMRQAVEKAAWVIRQAGIETEWIGSTNPAGRPITGLNWVFVRLLPRSMAERLARQPGSMGMALLNETGAFSLHALVFFDRVEENADQLGCYLPTVLALAIAHEIGHLLMGEGGHTYTGMMRSTWKRKDVKLAESGRMRFNRGQARKMRAQVEARMETVRARQESKSADFGG